MKNVEIATESIAIVLARREEKLKEVQAGLTTHFRVQAETMTADLADEQARQQIYDGLKQADRSMDVLVNNAGFGLHGMSWKIPWKQE